MKLLKSVLVLVFALSLSACGLGEKGPKEIIEQAANASENLNSMAMNIDMEQTVDMGEVKTKVTSNIDGTMTTDPLSMHIKGKTKAMGRSVKIEMYMAESGIFTKNANGQWMTMPSEMFNGMMKMSKEQAKPIEELKKLKEFASDFSIKEKNGRYVLNLTTGGKKFTDYIKNKVKATMSNGSFDEKALDKIKVNEVKYRFVLDKETYYPTSFQMSMDMSFKSPNGQKLNVMQNIKGTYSRYNEIDKIVVPEKVRKTAKDLSAM